MVVQSILMRFEKPWTFFKQVEVLSELHQSGATLKTPAVITLLSSSQFSAPVENLGSFHSFGCYWTHRSKDNVLCCVAKTNQDQHDMSSRDWKDPNWIGHAGASPNPLEAPPSYPLYSKDPSPAPGHHRYTIQVHEDPKWHLQGC